MQTPKIKKYMSIFLLLRDTLSSLPQLQSRAGNQEICLIKKGSGLCILFRQINDFHRRSSLTDSNNDI
jgi:hypothetical protein